MSHNEDECLETRSNDSRNGRIDDIQGMFEWPRQKSLWIPVKLTTVEVQEERDMYVTNDQGQRRDKNKNKALLNHGTSMTGVKVQS